MDKKEIKLQYKCTPRCAGVYQIRNAANGKVIVGSSLNLDGSKNRFEFERKTGCISKNRALQQDWQEHGADNFSFAVLEELKPNDDPAADRRVELATLEQKWLQTLQPYGERGYNRPPKEGK